MASEKEETCQVCGIEVAEIQCEDCARFKGFCRSCFDVVHRAPAKKTHKPKPLTPAITQISTELALQVYRCLTHVLEGRKYVCVRCHETVCADCMVIGKHQGHEQITFEEAVNQILGAFISELEVTKRTQVKAKELVAALAEERHAERTIFQTHVATVKEKFAAMQELLHNKMLELMAVVDREAERVDTMFGDLEKRLADVEQRLDHRMQYLKDTLGNLKETINPDNYVKLRDLRPDALHTTIESCMKDVQNTLNQRELYKVPPLLELDSLANAMKSLDFIPNPDLIVEGSYSVQSRELWFDLKHADQSHEGTTVEVTDLRTRRSLGAAVMNNRKATYSNAAIEQGARFRVAHGLVWNYTDCEINRPGLTLSRRSQFRLRSTMSMEYYCSAVKDSSKGQYYLVPNFNACTKLHRFNSLSEMAEGKKWQEVKLEQAFDGWYIAVRHGYLYHNVTNSDAIAVTDLATGKLLETLRIPNASYRNGPGTFKHSGYTDIALFFDEGTNKIYVMYQTQDDGIFKISELLVSSKHGLQFGHTWEVREMKKTTICFAFVYNDVAYFGMTHDAGAIQSAFSLASGKLLQGDLIQVMAIHENTNIHFMTLVPSDRAMIVGLSEPYRLCLYTLLP